MPTPSENDLIASITAKRQAQIALEDPAVRAADAAKKALATARVAERENGLMKLRNAVGAVNNQLVALGVNLIQIGSGGGGQPDNGDGQCSYAIELECGGYNGRYVAFRWTQGRLYAEVQQPLQVGQITPSMAPLADIVASAADEAFFRQALLAWVDQQIQP